MLWYTILQCSRRPCRHRIRLASQNRFDQFWPLVVKAVGPNTLLQMLSTSYRLLELTVKPLSASKWLTSI